MDAFFSELVHDLTSFDSVRYVRDLRKQIREDLAPGQGSMLPSFVHALPTGEETGDYLALDLGGSTFRVAIIRLLGNRKQPRVLVTKSWKVEEDAKVQNSNLFFDWLAACIAEVISSDNGSRRWQCGLAFSFPIEETSINTGRIMLMGKGYCFTDKVGDVCIKDKLDAAFERKGLHIALVAIVNDSLATMLTRNYIDERTTMSLILGTGCNSSLCVSPAQLPQSKVAKSAAHQNSTQVLVNAEMSMFGRELLPWTKYDRQLDQHATQPGYQTLEQFTSGRYLGEIIRLIFVDACLYHGFCAGLLPESLHDAYSFETSIMSLIAEDTDSDLATSCKILNAKYPKQYGSYTIREMRFIRDISALVSSRSACLIASSIFALSSLAQGQVNEEVGIAYCGTVIERYPGYLQNCQQVLDDLGSNLKLVQALDSGLLGAAITAAVVSRNDEILQEDDNVRMNSDVLTPSSYFVTSSHCTTSIAA